MQAPTVALQEPSTLYMHYSHVAKPNAWAWQQATAGSKPPTPGASRHQGGRSRTHSRSSWPCGLSPSRHATATTSQCCCVNPRCVLCARTQAAVDNRATGPPAAGPVPALAAALAPPQRPLLLLPAAAACFGTSEALALGPLGPLMGERCECQRRPCCRWAARCVLLIAVGRSPG